MRLAPLRRAAATGAAAVLAAGLVLVTGSAAQAHADIAWTSPGAGERVDRAPGEVVLHLTEAVVLDRTTVTVVDARGDAVAASRPTLTRDDDLDVRSPVSLHVTLPDLPPSTYHVAWRTVSTDDMHSTYGTFVFGVGTDVSPGDATAAAAGAPAWRAPFEAALRWTGFVGLATLIGATVVDLLGGGARPRVRRLAWRGGALAGSGALGTAGLLLAADSSALTSSRYGVVWAGYTALLVVATLLARRADVGTTARLRVQVAALGVASAAAGVSALVGHAAGASATPVRTAVVTAAHLLSTALWSGLLIGLVAVRARRDLLGRVALVAAPAVGVSVLSGLVLAGLLVPSAGALTGSAYGRLVWVKVALVAVAGLLGAVTASRSRRSVRQSARRTAAATPRTRTSRVVIAEALVLLTVLGAAAVLGSLAPPTSPRWAPTPTWQADAEARTAAGDDLLVTVSVTPNRPGSAFVATQVVSTRRPDPGPVTGVEVAVGSLAGVGTVDQGSGTWLSPAVDLRRSGPQGVTVTVHRADLPDTVVQVPWTVAPRPGTQAAGASTAPAVRLAVTLLAVALALGAAGAGVAGYRSRRRGADAAPARSVVRADGARAHPRSASTSESDPASGSDSLVGVDHGDRPTMTAVP